MSDSRINPVTHTTKPWLACTATERPSAAVIAENTSNNRRWLHEITVAQRLLRGVTTSIDGTGDAVLLGSLPLVSAHGYVSDSVDLRLVYSKSFLGGCGAGSPRVYLDSHRDTWQNGGDTHIEQDWRLCLFVPGECPIDFDSDDSLPDLLALVRTFMAKQRIFQRRLNMERVLGTRARWPGEARRHGIAGIREAIEEVGRPGRNDRCMCGSGRKFKLCCMNRLTE